MDKDGLVLYSYLGESAELLWGFRIYEDATKKNLLDWGEKFPYKATAMQAMTRALKKLKEGGVEDEKN